MKNNYQVRLLLLISVAVVCTLSVIQFYLVYNTYQLTREKYYTDVKREIGKITASKELEALADTSKEVLKRIAHQYYNEHLDKPAFFKKLALANTAAIRRSEKQFTSAIRDNPYLNGVHYKSQFDEIVLERNGHADTLLSQHQKPFLHLGSAFDTKNTLRLSTGNTFSTDNEHDKQDGRIRTYERFKLHFRQSEYVDVSTWKDEVLKRMYGVLVLAVGLIIGVIAVFYLVFRAMLRQKRLADVKTDFANNITHELKTPLSSAAIVFKTLNRQEVREDPRLLQELLGALKRQFNKIQSTVDSVLDSVMAPDKSVIMADTEMTTFLHAYIHDHMIDTHRLVPGISDENVIIKINVSLLEKVLDNLLQNAVKYSKPGSVIRLTAGREGDLYAISIRDNGPGIPRAQQQAVFEKFYRIPEQNLHTIKGLGLGLYLAKQTINALNGNLTLDSTVGTGSTFTIKLPINES